MGTSGLTFVFIRDDVLELAAELRPQSKIPIPTMMDWTRQSGAKDFFVNTPSMFSVYASQLMCEHMLAMGGIDYYESLADKKASKLYEFLDYSMNSGEELRFITGVEPRFRSRMNVPFNIGDDTTEKELLVKLKEEGFLGLKGHSSLGGIRASIYNSLEYSNVEALCDYLMKYQKKLNNRI